MNRRTLLRQMVAMAATSALFSACARASGEATAVGSEDQVVTISGEGGEGVTPLTKSVKEWQQLLPGDVYAVLFEEATEPPFSSPLLNEHRAGTFICAGCNLPLFSSTTKYESGTGWPSFYESLTNSIGTKDDFSLLMARTEYHCLRCGGHQGHLFDDGPAPTGKRYCNNGLAILFVPEEQPLPALRS